MKPQTCVVIKTIWIWLHCPKHFSQTICIIPVANPRLTKRGSELVSDKAEIANGALLLRPSADTVWVAAFLKAILILSDLNL